MDLSKLSDEEIHNGALLSVRREKEQLSITIQFLLENDSRKLFSAKKYDSLYAYAMGFLGLSSDEASRRISAVKLIQEVPEVEQKLADGTLSLTNVCSARTLFRKEPCSTQKKKEVLKKLENTSTKKAKKILLQESKSPVSLMRDQIAPVTETHNEVTCYMDEETLQLLEEAKGLLAQTNPEVLNGMGDLIKAMAKVIIQAKRPDLQKPPAPARVENPKTVTKSAKYTIWQKAQGKCQNCNSTFKLQTEHCRPQALGGSHNPENLRLLCQSCNLRQAIETYGRSKMRRHFQKYWSTASWPAGG